MISAPTFQAGAKRRTVLAAMRQAFAASGIETAALDARLLLGHALSIEVTELLAHDDLPISSEGAHAASEMTARRQRGESVARIIGVREFWGLPFHLSPETLEPRPDTETVIEAIAEICPDKNAASRILDLGTGTGCILIALLTEFPSASGIGIDISPEAVKTAEANATRNAVSDRATFLISDWFSAVNGQFDLIVSNPPYIRSEVIGTLEREVRDFDPRRALEGGTDGLNAYRRILAQAPSFLKPGGQVVFEIGYDQWPSIAALGNEAGFRQINYRRDLSGLPRVVWLAEHEQGGASG